MSSKDINYYSKANQSACGFSLHSVSCLFFFMMLAFYPVTSHAQKGTSFKPMGMPEVYIMPQQGSDNENIMAVIPGSTWRIFSGIDGNIAYSNSDGRIPVTKVSFSTPLLVENEKDGFLHVFSYSNPAVPGDPLASTAKEVGWIKKNTAILWSHCLLDSLGQEMQLITSSTTGTLKLIEDDKNDGIDLFSDPGLTQKTGRKTSANQLYFIFKMNENSVLIANDRRIGYEDKPGDVLLGWVPVSYCFFLSNHFWLSPNDNPEAIKEQKSKGLFPTLFINADYARQYAENMIVPSRFILWNDLKHASYPPDWFRFPIISEKNHVLKVAIVDDDFKNAYTCDQVTGFTYGMFKRVTLISNNDLNNVTSNMKKFLEVYNTSDARSRLHKIIVKLLSDEFQDIDPEFVNNMTFKQIFEKLFWICDQQSPILALKLRRIEDPSALPDKVLEDFFASLKSKEAQLSLITVRDYDQVSFLSNNNRYFWIDVSLFL